MLCCCLFWDESHSTTQRAWDQATQLLSKTKRLLSMETREVFILLHLFSFVSCLQEMCSFTKADSDTVTLFRVHIYSKKQIFFVVLKYFSFSECRFKKAIWQVNVTRLALSVSKFLKHFVVGYWKCSVQSPVLYTVPSEFMRTARLVLLFSFYIKDILVWDQNMNMKR